MLNGLFWVLSAGLTALTLALRSLSLWWALLLLPGYYLAVGAAFLILLLAVTPCLPKRHTFSPACRRLLVWAIRWVLPFLGCQVRAEGLERLPEEPFLLVGNHVSNLDPLVAMAALSDRKLAFVSKPENFRYPVAGPLMRCSGFLPIDRENARHAAATIHRAADAIGQGLCMGIYPEGTRNKSGQGLLPFHAGSFKIAKYAHCPIAVVTVQYVRTGFPGFRRVHFQVAQVMDTAFVEENRTDTLCARARDIMEQAMDSSQ